MILLLLGVTSMAHSAPNIIIDPPSAKPFRPNSNLVQAITKAENIFMDPGAIGGAGELGLMQILPETARQPGVGVSAIDPDTLLNSATNVQFGTDYLNGIYEHFDFDLDKTIAAWNNGISNVTKAVKKGGDDWLAVLEDMMEVNKPTDYLMKVKGFLRGKVPTDAD